MSIQTQILNDIQQARKQKDADRVSDLSFVLGEFNRIAKQVTDEMAFTILRKIRKNEESLGGSADQNLLDLIDTYLPQPATEEEIIKWIQANVDFTQYKNRLQAMKEIMAAFAGRTDGSRVKTILQKM
jgi:uncharacterized protein YqeY